MAPCSPLKIPRCTRDDGRAVAFFLRIVISFCLLIQPSFADVRFLVLSDPHYDSANISGDLQDSGDTLLNSALTKFNELSKKVDFILTLGDFPTHGLLSATRRNTDIKTVFHKLYQADTRGKPIFYITGNNDSPLGNYQPFSWKGQSPLTLAVDWQGACAYCNDLIIDKSHMVEQGYYSSYVLPHNKEIILIALNTVLFAKPPFFIRQYTNQSEAAFEQLQWLAIQLKTHQAKQLLIAMHLPPGYNNQGYPIWHDVYLKQFIQLLNRYQKNYTQISLLTSHTHMDDVRKIRLEDGKNIYTYATPSISRIHHNNPGMKVFDLGSNLQLKDYTTYYTTSDSTWGSQSYQALKNIVPTCKNTQLASCLDALTPKALCKIFRDGLFYGVKSSRVDSSVCHVTFPVN